VKRVGRGNKIFVEWEETWVGGGGGHGGGDKEGALCILQASWYLQVVLAIGGSEGAKESHELGTDRRRRSLVCLSSLLLLLLHLYNSLRGIQEGLFQVRKKAL
jgi:hypothetical protein